MPDIGPAEIVIILLVIVLLFGGAKLPKLARSLGSAKGEFEKGLKEGEKASKELDVKPVEAISVEAPPVSSDATSAADAVIPPTTPAQTSATPEPSA